MRNFENNLDVILERLRTYGIRSFPSCNLPLSSQELIFLSAKGLIELHQYKNNDTEYKITITNKGMTRRLDPMDRIKELGDASVPFSFDVHSFIFSDDAVGLEAELHKRLHSKRKNKINNRKEFFDISIDELETLVQEINPAAEFNRTMVAMEYRQSIEQ